MLPIVNNYKICDGFVIDRCNDISPWSIRTNSIISPDAEHFTYGSSAIKMQDSGANNSYFFFKKSYFSCQRNIEMNFPEGIKKLSLDVYIPDIAKLSGNIEVYFTSVSNMDSYYKFSYPVSMLSNGQNTIVMGVEDIKNFREYFNKTMVKMVVQARSRFGERASFTFGNIRANVESKHRLIFTWDDAHASLYSLGFKNYFKPMNIPCTMYVATAKIGTTNGIHTYMTLDQIKELKDNGWSIANHTINHLHLKNITDIPTLEKEILGARDYLVSQGFPEAAEHFAYPFGEYNDTVVQFLKDNGFKTARTTCGGLEWFEIDNFFELKSFDLNKSTKLSSFFAQLKRSVLYGGNMNIFSHTVDKTDFFYGTNSKFLNSFLKNAIEINANFVNIETFYNEMTNLILK